MKHYAWLDNKLASCKLQGNPLLGAGFLYGQGLFETMRSYKGRVFLLERHIRRLIDSCIVMQIKAPKTQLLKKAVEETVRRNKLASGYARLNVYKKDKGAGIFVFTERRKFYQARDYRQGFSAAVIRDARQNESSPLARVKSLNHYFYIWLGQRAQGQGADEAIILNAKGNVCEGSRSNIFTVKKGVIFTPPIEAGCLPGITRQIVIEIARGLKLDLFQMQLKPADLLTSDEAFVTNSLIEIMPLTRVDNKVIGQARMGNLTRSVLTEYRRLVAENYK